MTNPLTANSPVIFRTISKILIAGFILTSLAIAAESRIIKHQTKGRLGKVFSSPHGGQIFGFDINQNGTDGANDESVSNGSADDSYIETFDIQTAKLTKIVKSLKSATGDQELVFFGIGGKDVGLVDEERVIFKNGHVTRNDKFFLMNPVSGKKVTGPWTLPHSKGALLFQLAPNQTTNNQVALVYRDTPDFDNAIPWLYVTDLATNKVSKSIKLTSFEDDFLMEIAQDTTTNEVATFINSYPGGPPPVNVVISLKTGKLRQFNGFNNGFYGAGAVNGLAVDSTTGILCTATSLNAQVEFYKLSNGKGVWAQLPGTGDTDQLGSASAVANDPVNHLFLIAQPISSTGGNSTVYVYDEKGNLKETINGFTFLDGASMKVNPKLRIGYVNGPTVTQLQQFFY